jgi:hypothetical protein
MAVTDMEVEQAPDRELLYLDDATFKELAIDECFKRKPDDNQQVLRSPQWLSLEEQPVWPAPPSLTPRRARHTVALPPGAPRSTTATQPFGHLDNPAVGLGNPQSTVRDE